MSVYNRAGTGIRMVLIIRLIRDDGDRMNGKKAQYIGVGVGLGAAFGIMLGMLLFPENIALGIPLGIAIGMGIGWIWSQQLGDDED